MTDTIAAAAAAIDDLATEVASLSRTVTELTLRNALLTTRLAVAEADRDTWRAVAQQ